MNIDPIHVMPHEDLPVEEHMHWGWVYVVKLPYDPWIMNY
jgi:hypothetical protein